MRQNSALFWDTLLNSAGYLSDTSMFVLDRVGYTLKWLKPYGTYLNIGSGQGYIEEAYRVHIMGGHVDWTALDISEIGLRRIKSLYKVKTVKASVTKIPISLGKFDNVICMEVLEHIPKNIINSVYQNIYRLLSDNGYLVISVPVFETVPLKNHSVGHLRKYTPDLIKSEIIANKFRIINEKHLYAFNDYYLIKSVLAGLSNTRRPNIAIYLCTKN
jgi:2-polyprenyl-3-methyl-5-hydroxy-6-metoxy-1,4-benzoquinol methylase